jgi:hypothetical protein
MKVVLDTNVLMAGIPYQNLINLFLRECAHASKNPPLLGLMTEPEISKASPEFLTS